MVRARAPQRFRQDRHRRIRARACARSASGCSPPAAPRRSCEDAGLAVTEVADHTGFPGDARRPGEDPASEGARRHPRAARFSLAHESAGAARASRRIDLVVVNLYPFRETVARARLHAGRGGREHRHRRPGHGAQRGQELRARRGRDRSRPTTRAARGDRPARAAASAPLPASGSRRRRSPTRPPTTARSATTSPRSTPPASARPSRIASTCSSSSRSLCATGRTRTRRPLSTATRSPRRAASRATAGAGQGAFVQQHRRRRCGLGMREELRPAGVRHRQARQSRAARRWRRRWRRPTGRRSPPTPPPPSAASSPFNGELDMRRRPGRDATVRRSGDRAGHRRRGGRGCWRARPMFAC